MYGITSSSYHYQGWLEEADDLVHQRSLQTSEEATSYSRYFEVCDGEYRPQDSTHEPEEHGRGEHYHVHWNGITFLAHK